MDYEDNRKGAILCMYDIDFYKRLVFKLVKGKLRALVHIQRIPRNG